MTARLTPFLVLALLGLLFFGEFVLHPGQILYSDYSDFIAEYIPVKRFLVRSWQETGALPLWCPYSFAGMPFLHDIQTTAFYPLQWPLFLLPEDGIGPGMSWLVAAHVILAGWCMYAYARSQPLSRPGALVAACGYMFAGKVMLHLLVAGHYNFLGLAWLPLVLLGLEQAMRRNSLLWATGAGTVYALVILGTYPQVTFYAGLFSGLWTLGLALEQAGWWDKGAAWTWRRTGQGLGRWLGYGAWAALVAVALAAVQLLPTLDLVGQATRGGGTPLGPIFSSGLRLLVSLAGPPLILSRPMLWEERGGCGVLWIAAAACAPLLGGPRTRYQAAVCLVLFLFALGGAAALQELPGFRFFRLPARMLGVAALPLALLAGTTTDALFTGLGPPPAVREHCRRRFTHVLAVTFLLIGGFALQLWSEGRALHFHIYWASLLVTAPAAYRLLGPRATGARDRGALAWGTVLLTDLWALAWPLVAVRPAADVYAPPRCVGYVIERRGEPERVLDRDVSVQVPSTPLGTGAALALYWHLESLRGCNPLDVLRYKEYLQFIADADQPVLPFQHSLAFPVIGNFPIKNKALLDLLGTRYLVQPSDRPLEQEGWEPVAHDPHPRAYDFITGGVQELPAYTVYYNQAAFPRAFVVPEAAPLPERSEVLRALKATDFRRRVLLEGGPPTADSATATGDFRPAVIREYLPNRVVVGVDTGPPGYLVLADVWFPGWTCLVDGQPAPLYRANFLFRAVVLPAGPHEVVFTFDPASYRRGKAISGGALAGVAGLSLLAVLRKSAAANRR
jgi:hypothetical protein